ncbi:hypothetical protein B0F87_1171 [Methylobacter tundripaludum]|uniref:Uncharacterized protein n=1 Tax=Methylobacter tundripaludum TaxID=173365 RepID=A0A2S6H4V1_9GAMM|nr:hypothetical protein [Methylobacter tundripaludum]PPK72519.1 hypothetical protein B0F87_1171 [Methylobacter tundripaludum]
MKPHPALQTLLTVLPVLTAGLYLLGLSYNQGYLAVFGVDDSVFPLASDKALFTGFVSLVTLTFPAVLYAIGAFVAFIVLIFVAAVLSSTARVQSLITRIEAWITHRRPAGITSSIAGDLIDKSATVYWYASGFVLALLLFLVMAMLSDKAGHEQAEKEVADFQSGKAISAQLFSPQVPSPYLGKLVMCGDKYCAFWSNAGTIVVRHEAIDRIVTHNPWLKGMVTSPPQP